MTRISKAWTVHPIHRNDFDSSDIVYAPTRSKAKYVAWLSWNEWFGDDLKIHQIVARLSKRNDIVLPDEHRLVSELTETQRSIVSNAYGSHGRYFGHRNHYCTSPCDRDLLHLAWTLGLFRGPVGETEYGGHSPMWVGAFFFLTDLGKEVARSMIPTYR